MIEIDVIQSLVSLSIFDKLVSLLVETHVKLWVISGKSVNLVMKKFSKLFSILDEFYNKTS